MKNLIDDLYTQSSFYMRKAASLWDTDRNASQEATDTASLMREAAMALQEKTPARTAEETML